MNLAFKFIAVENQKPQGISAPAAMISGKNGLLLSQETLRAGGTLNERSTNAVMLLINYVPPFIISLDKLFYYFLPASLG